MSRHWKEALDTERHRNFMDANFDGWFSIRPSRDNLIPKSVYFVNVAGFTFQFVSLEQIRVCRDWFSQRIHPSSRIPDIDLEHFWQRWYERLPKHITKESKRTKIVDALEKAILEFEQS